MIKIVVDWILYTLRIKKRSPKQTGIDALVKLIPIVMIAVMVMSIIAPLCPTPRKLSWWQNIGRWLYLKWGNFRRIVIGY